MSQDNEQYAINVSNVSKTFRVYHDKPRTLKDSVLRFGRGTYHDFHALDNVSFDIPKGYTVGIMGKNGSGKSTLLKLLSRTMFPDEGKISVNGKVYSLIELGAGFHLDMTGRENIYNNAAIFGLTREQIDKKMGSIIAFSELEDFIDTPVRTYSSGMYARLAFSVAIHVDADILLVDEILAVGDMNFQNKCEEYFASQQKLGKTIVIVTHDATTIEKLCDYAILLENGKVIAQGIPEEVNHVYRNRMTGQYKPIADSSDTEEEVPIFDENRPLEPMSGVKRWGNQNIIIYNLKLLDIRNNPRDVFTVGDEIKISFNYACRIDPDLLSPIFGFSIYTMQGLLIYESDTQINNQQDFILKPRGNVRIVVNKLQILPGEYILNIFIRDKDGVAYDYMAPAKIFAMESKFNDIGLIRLDHSIQIGSKDK
ncbi:MAG: ABC transporter ATP-binding protein [Deferribacterales bacterium]|nr:ABC transporter ATP-binding protein [Deferribacterales bacterium]